MGFRALGVYGLGLWAYGLGRRVEAEGGKGIGWVRAQRTGP